jgi:hypothetical protein
MALSRTAQCSSCRWGMWTSGCTRWRCCCAPCTRPGPSSLGKDMSPTALRASSQRRPLTSRTRTDRHRDVEALARGRVEEVERGVAVDRELRERGPRGRGARAVLAALEAAARRAHARGAAAGAAPRAPGVVRGEGDRLCALGREREAARQRACAQHAGEEGGVDLRGAVVEDGQRAGSASADERGRQERDGWTYVAAADEARARAGRKEKRMFGWMGGGLSVGRLLGILKDRPGHLYTSCVDAKQSGLLTCRPPVADAVL